MVNRWSLWDLVPEPVRRMPADIVAVIVLTAFTLGSVFVPIVQETPLRIVFGLTFVLFLPGYAIIAALFPEEGTPPNVRDRNEEGNSQSSEDGILPNKISHPRTDRGIDGIERVVLSFGVSIVVVPLIGLALNYTAWGIRLVPVALTIAIVTVLAAVIATFRRWELPVEERFEVPYREWTVTGRSELLEPGSRGEAVLNVVLVVSVLLAVSSVAYAVAIPPDSERFTELYLLSEEEDGELVADEYPEEFVLGESESVILGIGNNEHETVEYSVIVQLQEVEGEGNETTIRERQQLDRFDVALSHNETEYYEHELEPTMTGENLRVEYLLYRGEPPTNPTGENAYRTVHIWVDVEENSVDAADG